MYDAFFSYRNWAPDKAFALHLVDRLEEGVLCLAIDVQDFWWFSR